MTIERHWKTGHVNRFARKSAVVKRLQLGPCFRPHLMSGLAKQRRVLVAAIGMNTSLSMNMRSVPQTINTGWPELSSSSTEAASVCNHDDMGPSGVDDQSKSVTRARIRCVMNTAYRLTYGK